MIRRETMSICLGNLVGYVQQTNHKALRVTVFGNTRSLHFILFFSGNKMTLRDVLS